MITVEQARALLFDLVGPLAVEEVPLSRANGRVLAREVTAQRDQPPFDASSMDGYAIKTTEAQKDSMFRVIGESAAGHGFAGTVKAGEAVRIFTGAPMPQGADFVVIQEDVSRNGDLITISDDPGTNPNVRAAGGDFRAGTAMSAPRRLRPQDIALLASMNVSRVPVTRKPVIALISTGDELVMPGEEPGPDQIIASNTFGLRAMLEEAGAEPRVLPIARDSHASLGTAFDLARGADMIVTIGGASVGDHDLVGEAAGNLGLKRSFYKIAMRPGKPLMAGRMGDAAMVGLPGNPVSAIVCGYLFLVPMVHAMLGLGADTPTLHTARVKGELGANGPREHYMRAVVKDGVATVFDNQDSAMLGVLAVANALVVRPPNDPALADGAEISYLPI